MGAHEHGWWILLHVVLFVFWLGGDLGVYVSSRFVLRTDLTPAARSTALNIMLGLDLGPRVCLVLFLPSGVTLMALEPHGADLFTWWGVILVWIFSLGWLGLTVHEHLRHGAHPVVPAIDRLIRCAVVVGMLGAGAYTIAVDEPFGVTTHPRWLGVKVVLYATAIACGLGIRARLRPFGPAFGELMGSGSTPDVEARLKRSIEGCVPFVLGIWVSVLAAAALGVLKPGAAL